MGNCPYCNCRKTAKRGFSKGKQRYYCCGCKKTFSEHKNPSYKKEWVFRLFLNKTSKLRIAKMTGVPYSSVLRWIKEKEQQGGFVCLTTLSQNYAEKEIIMIKNLKKYLKEEQKGETYALLLTSKGSVALDLR